MKRPGLTLLELLVVLTILVALATLIVPQLSYLGQGSQKVSTRENLLRLQELLVNRYVPDMGGTSPLPNSGLPANLASNLPWPNMAVTATLDLASTARVSHPQLRYLFVNPDTETPSQSTTATFLSTRRWQGPYITHNGARYGQAGSASANYANNFTTNYGIADVVSTSSSGVTTITSPGDPTVVDAWGNPIVIQLPNTSAADDWTYARLVSAGPNGVIDTPENVRMPDNTTSATGRGDDVIMFLFRDDQYGSGTPTLTQ